MTSKEYDVMLLRAVLLVGAVHLTVSIPPPSLFNDAMVGGGQTESSDCPIQFAAAVSFCQVPLLHLSLPTPKEPVPEQVNEQSAPLSDMTPQRGLLVVGMMPIGEPAAPLIPALLVDVGIGQGPTMHPNVVSQFPFKHCNCPICVLPELHDTGQMKPSGAFAQKLA
jgi:hypothetical protein